MPQSAYSTINSEWISIGADYFNNFNISISRRAYEPTAQLEGGRASFLLRAVVALLNSAPAVQLPAPQVDLRANKTPFGVLSLPCPRTPPSCAERTDLS